MESKFIQLHKIRVSTSWYDTRCLYSLVFYDEKYQLKNRYETRF